MKIKFAVFTLSLLMVLTMSTGAFAQSGTFQPSASATQGRMNGHAERAGGITLALTTGTVANNAANGTVVIDYGVPITNAVRVGGERRCLNY